MSLKYKCGFSLNTQALSLCVSGHRLADFTDPDPTPHDGPEFASQFRLQIVKVKHVKLARLLIKSANDCRKSRLLKQTLLIRSEEQRDLCYCRLDLYARQSDLYTSL